MKITMLRTCLLTAVLITPLAISVGCTQSGNVGSSKEVSHTESDKTGWFGGRTHAANTLYQNSDGSSSLETETTTTKGDTTTITRVKKTTFVDGTVKSDTETRTIVKGTDSVERQSKTTTN